MARLGEGRVTVAAYSPDGGALAFAPDGWMLASASGDGTVRLWVVP